MREAPPDPGAATEVPQERAKLPALPPSPREWVRSSWRRGGAGSDEDLRAVDELSDEVHEPRGVDVRPAPAPTPTPPALALVEDEPTDHGATPVAQKEPWKWNDPYLELAPPARQLAYLAHMCQLLERQEYRYQQEDPRDPVLGEALEQAQQHFNGTARRRTRDQLIRKGVEVGLAAVGEAAEKRRLTPAALLSGIAGFGLAASIALVGFVLDHLDVLIALARGL